METPFTPAKVFCSYAKEDASLLEQLERHLSPLRQEGLITISHQRLIGPGTDWKVKVDRDLKTASLILLLISPDFFASDYCYGSEMQQAMHQHEVGKARVIPLLLRSCDWQSAPFASLQVLPTTERPITAWRDRDAAWTDVVQGIRVVLEAFLKGEEKKELPVPQAHQPIQIPKQTPIVDTFPPMWNVPYRYTPFFTGRDQVVEALFSTFTTASPSGMIPVQALTGLGGLGKTQTAVAYAFRYRKQYQTVLWIKAETETDLVTSFTTMAKLLGLPATGLHQRESVRASVQQWLSTHTEWLLIFDNADDLTLVEPFLPMKFPSGHLLLTTRATAMHGLAQPLPLKPLEPEDGALCLLRRATYLGWNADLSNPALSAAARSAALDLSVLMGGLPLALEQAGAYIETTGRGVRGYLELYEKYRPEIQKNQYGDILYYRTAVAFTWNLAREVVQQESPAAIELLSLCAYLAPDAIPYQLFPKDVSILGSTLGPVAASDLALDQVLALLHKYSLIEKEVDRMTDAPRIFLHRVLQEVLRDGMDAETQRLWAERAVRVVAQALPPVVVWPIMQAQVQNGMQLIEQWGMSFHEADLIREYVAREREQ